LPLPGSKSQEKEPPPLESDANFFLASIVRDYTRKRVDDRSVCGVFDNLYKAWLESYKLRGRPPSSTLSRTRKTRALRMPGFIF
jgi:hypothetical protein